MSNYRSELVVITKAKDLCSYVMTVTQKSPKHFRYTFVSRLQNLTLDIVEKLYRANDYKLSEKNLQQRQAFQRSALTDLRVLAYFTMLSMEQQCILPKQYEQISQKSSDCMNLLRAWINSDAKRLQRI